MPRVDFGLGQLQTQDAVKLCFRTSDRCLTGGSCRSDDISHAANLPRGGSSQQTCPNLTPLELALCHFIQKASRYSLVFFSYTCQFHSEMCRFEWHKFLYIP